MLADMTSTASTPPAIWDIARPFIKPVTVGPEHLDAFGHTNNVMYLHWLEDVAWAHSNLLGLDMAAYRRLNAGCVVRRHELDYLAPTFVGDKLLTATWIHENNGRLDMWRRYQIIRVADGKTILRGASQWVCVDMGSGRPKRQPAEFIAAYATGRGAVD